VTLVAIPVARPPRQFDGTAVGYGAVAATFEHAVVASVATAGHQYPLAAHVQTTVLTDD